MVRGTHLSAYDYDLKKSLYEIRIKITDIAVRVGHHRNTITNFLKNLVSYMKTKRYGRATNIGERYSNDIKRLTVEREIPCKKTKHHLIVIITRNRLSPLLVDNKVINSSRESFQELLSSTSSVWHLRKNINLMLLNSQIWFSVTNTNIWMLRIALMSTGEI